MDELGPCPSTYVLLMFDAVCVRNYYLIIYYDCVMIMDEVMKFVLIK